ncbi:hypothetical protein pb186bvf_010495 [Paramecium bursaria]
MFKIFLIGQNLQSQFQITCQQTIYQFQILGLIYFGKSFLFINLQNYFNSKYYQIKMMAQNKSDDLLEINCQTFYNVKQLIIDEQEVIDKTLQCAICRELLIDPTECQTCQNSFCFDCIGEWLKSKEICPFRCQQPEFKQSHKVIRNLLESLLLKCPNHSRGCRVQIQQKYLCTHLRDECEFYSLQCRNIGCSKIMNRAQWNEHQQICLYRLVYCEICKQRFKYDLNHNCQEETISKYRNQCAIQQKQIQKQQEIIKKQAKQIAQFKEEQRKQKYQCQQKHQLNWQSLLKGKCKKCRATNITEIIRTECEQCEEKYCIKCMPVYIFNDKCPIGHAFQQVTDADQCEICFKSGKFDGWKDLECDIDVCNECYGNGTIDF